MNFLEMDIKIPSLVLIQFLFIIAQVRGMNVISYLENMFWALSYLSSLEKTAPLAQDGSTQ